SAANVDAANSISDTITFDSSLSGAVITLTQGQLELSGAGTGVITIAGSNLASPISVSGNFAGRVFLVDFDVNAVLAGLTIEAGSVGFDGGGGISNSGT